MKVALVSEHASPLAPIGGVDVGGQNVHVAGLAAALHRDGHDVTVYTRRDDGDLPETTTAPAGFHIVHVPAGPASHVSKDELLPYMGDFGRWLALRFADPVHRPDVLHAHFWMSGVATVFAAGPHRLPTVLTYHALGAVKRRHQRGADRSPRARIPVERELGRRVDRVVAQCTDELGELTALGVPAGNVTVVPSGVDTALFRPDGPAVCRTNAMRRIVSVGRLVPRKGFDHMIKAMTRLPDAELVILGGQHGGLDADPEARRLHELARVRGVARRVRLVGPVPAADLPAWYRSADLLACTPWYEPFGLTPLEAMACGTPVVTYAVGGLADTVVDGKTGRHIAPGDLAGMVAAVRELLDDDGMRRQFGEAAASRTRAHYTWSNTAASVADLYGALVARRLGVP
jgi:glycosyltransferase involved in cell wall biosynthesis